MIADFLKPPTDNLYKFMCISGLILVLLSLMIPTWQLNKIRQSYLEQKRDLEILDLDSEMTEHREQRLTQQADELNKTRAILLKQVETLESDTALKGRPLTEPEQLSVKGQLEQLYTLQNQLEKKNQEWLEKMSAVLTAQYEQRKRLIEIRYKNEAALSDARAGVAIAILSLFTIVFGFWMGRKGFNLWSLRVQVYQDAILKKQAEEIAPK